METRRTSLLQGLFLLAAACALALAAFVACPAYADDTAPAATPSGNLPDVAASSTALDPFASMPAATTEPEYIPLPALITNMQSDQATMLGMVNSLRSSNGVQPLTWNSNLADAATQRAAEIAYLFDHTRPHGASCFSLNSEIYGENIAWCMLPKGMSSTELIFNSWVGSQGHLANMLGSDYKSIAIGHAVIDAGDSVVHLWVQLFGLKSYSGTAPGSADVQEVRIVPMPLDAAKSISADPSNLLLDASGSAHPPIVIEYQESATLMGAGQEWGDSCIFVPAGTMRWGDQSPSLVGDFFTDKPGIVSYDPDTDALIAGKEMGTANCTVTLATAPSVAVNYTATNSAFTRLAGFSAEDTAAQIAFQTVLDMGATTSQYAVIARNDDFADAMSATGLAGVLKAPILLTSPTGLSPATGDALTSLDVKKVYIVGGPGAVLPRVETDIAAMGISVERVYGEYSWDTSVKCAEKIHALGGNPRGEAIVAMSTNFQDALSISPLAYRDSIPILLQGNGTTIPRALTDDELTFITTQTSGTIWVPGGPGAVPTATVEDILGKGTPHNREIVRMWGYDGYDTSLEIAKTLTERNRADVACIVIASGAQKPRGVDALAGAALAGINNGVILLVNANSAIEGIHTEAVDGFLLNGYAGFDFMDAFRAGAAKGYILGGSFVMPYSYEAELSIALGSK